MELRSGFHVILTFFTCKFCPHHWSEKALEPGSIGSGSVAG